MITLLILTVCVLLVAAILAQNSKGLLRNAAAVKVIGVSGSKQAIEKATWGLAILFVLACLY